MNVGTSTEAVQTKHSNNKAANIILIHEAISSQIILLKHHRCRKCDGCKMDQFQRWKGFDFFLHEYSGSQFIDAFERCESVAIFVDKICPVRRSFQAIKFCHKNFVIIIIISTEFIVRHV